ncbi:S41 family peptidase [Niabella pedocola]|uniref:S41 family peptidase n=1 Tax=Niabella pedocola TaxID=1752077 RepID=A0ABS8PUY8_9BACT|nr:S41 family peptidase [Niabella pedocola]MCD2424888.1 S41 family peptidase [Niabella pedocola]
MKFLKLTVLCLLLHGACKAQYLYERVVQKHAPAAIQSDIAQLYKDLKKYHLNLIQYISPGELKKDFDRLQQGITDSLTARQVYYRLLPVISRIGDGHMALNYFDPEKITEQDIATFILRYDSPFSQLQLRFIGKKIFALAHTGEGKTIPPGAAIEQINGLSPEVIIDSVLKFMCSDGYNTTFKYFFLNYRALSGLWEYVFHNCETLNVVYAHHQSVDSVIIRGKPTTPAVQQPDSVNRKQPFLNFRRMDRGTAYLKVNTFEPAWDAADQQMFAMVFLKELSQTSHLILDLRGNTGGQQGLMLMLLKGLITKPVQPVKFPSELIKGVVLPPSDTVKRNQLKYVKDYNLQGWGNVVPFNGSYKNKLYVLVNGGTFSAAAIMANALGMDKRAVLIGEETGGGRNTTTAGIMFHNRMKHTGVAYSFGLIPFNATNPVTETGHGLRPDITVTYTLEDYLNSRDLEMEQALKLIESGR